MTKNNNTKKHPPTTTTKKKQKNKNKKNTQLLTVIPELVILDCSLTHVLQTPNTQPYHS